MKKRFMILSVAAAVLLQVFIIAAQAAVNGAKKEGLVEYVGAQKTIFATGKADSVVSLEELANRKSLYAMGPVDGLDGEITIFDSEPYITQVRGADYTLDKSFKHGAIFLVWTEQEKWKDLLIPANVKGYLDLQQFVKAQAQATGIDVTKPFPFLIA